jgi:hypothetical protein
MKFELPELPYAIGDLDPHLTARTLVSCLLKGGS